MPVTFITAFFKPKTGYRDTETYFQHFGELANTGIPILLFLDNVFCDRVFPTNVTTVFVSLDTSWVPDNVQLPAGRNPNKDTLDYFCIQLSKLHYLTQALEYTTSSHVAWIDFGVFHMFRDNIYCKTLLRQIAQSDFPNNCILAPGCWDMGTYDLNNVCWRFCGSFLLCDRNNVKNTYTRQTELVQQYLPLLTWEVNYWSRMDDYFIVYPANHDDTLLSRVMTFVQRPQGV